MESFFGKFKPELGNPARYNTPETLFEVVAKNIYRYNNTRIHTKLKMSPAAYTAGLKKQEESRDRVLQEVGA
jgi:hypothetical protein